MLDSSKLLHLPIIILNNWVTILQLLIQVNVIFHNYFALQPNFYDLLDTWTLDEVIKYGELRDTS